MQTEPRKEHKWLDRLIGDWTFEAECVMGPDQPAMKMTGSETVRSLGGLWVIAEGRGEMPDGNEGNTILTIGFDTRRNSYVGSWVGSMMDTLWHYDGSMDSAEKVLTLEAEGPMMQGDGKAKYRDVIEVIDDNHRKMASYLQGEDGAWTLFMTAHYTRRGH